MTFTSLIFSCAAYFSYLAISFLPFLPGYFFLHFLSTVLYFDSLLRRWQFLLSSSPVQLILSCRCFLPSFPHTLLLPFLATVLFFMLLVFLPRSIHMYITFLYSLIFFSPAYDFYPVILISSFPPQLLLSSQPLLLSFTSIIGLPHQITFFYSLIFSSSVSISSQRSCLAI